MLHNLAAPAAATIVSVATGLNNGDISNLKVTPNGWPDASGEYAQRFVPSFSRPRHLSFRCSTLNSAGHRASSIAFSQALTASNHPSREE